MFEEEGLIPIVLKPINKLLRPIADAFKSEGVQDTLDLFGVSKEYDPADSIEVLSEELNNILRVPFDAIRNFLVAVTENVPLLGDIFEGLNEAFNDIEMTYWEQPDRVCPEGELSFEIPSPFPPNYNICISEQAIKNGLLNPAKALDSIIDCGLGTLLIEPATKIISGIGNMAMQLDEGVTKGGLKVDKLTETFAETAYEVGRLFMLADPQEINEIGSCWVDRMTEEVHFLDCNGEVSYPDPRSGR
jgi:hypothetical protein